MVEVTKYSGTLGTCFEMCHYVIILISADTHNLKKRKINVYMTWCTILPTVFVVMKETMYEIERVKQTQKTVERHPLTSFSLKSKTSSKYIGKPVKTIYHTQLHAKWPAIIAHTWIDLNICDQGTRDSLKERNVFFEFICLKNIVKLKH